VTYATYAINQAFNTYNDALSTANQLAAVQVPATIQLLDPPQKMKHSAQRCPRRLIGGSILTRGTNPIIGALVTGATATNSILGLLFPSGTANNQMQELATIDQKLEQVTQTLQGNINTALPMILKDPQAFLWFAQNGQFSQVPQESLFGDSSKLLVALNTYVVSQCLQANSIIVARGPVGTDINAFVAGGDAQNYQIPNCGKGYDQNDICDTWYYDAAHQNSYALVSLTKCGNSYNSEMEQIANQWGVNGSMLMARAADCSDAGGAQKQGALISAVPGGINSNCLSNPIVCTWNQDKASDAKTLFQESACANPIPVWGPGNRPCSVTSGGTKMPYGYIGPLWMDKSNGGACR
jgi:hypothetical protein